MKNLVLTGGGVLKHKLIIGDNYPALLNLLITYKKKIKVIYIDPPYGKDDLGDFAKTNYDNAITRDNLLSMLYPRLMLAKELLRDDGIIFCSIDDKNQAYLKCLFDEVFGEHNFVANLVWHSKNKPSGNTQIEKSIDTRTEYILLYKKIILDVNNYENTKEELERKNYILKDDFFNERGHYKLTPLMHSCGASSFKYIESLDYEIQAPDGTMFKNHKNIKKPKSYCYTWSKRLFEFGLKNGFIEFAKTSDGEWVANRKMYEFFAIDSNRLEIVYRKSGNAYYNLITNKLIENIYSDNGANEVRKILNEKIFSNPKPINLIKHLLKISTSTNKKDEILNDFEQEIILDFFSGSGTTGHAVLELNREDGGNRKFILVTNNEKNDLNPNGIAYDVTAKRLKRIMTGKCYDGSTNFKWIEKNKPYGNSLEVTEIKDIANNNKKVFEMIDEKLYDKDFNGNIQDKINWVCREFEITCKKIEGEKLYE